MSREAAHVATKPDDPLPMQARVGGFIRIEAGSLAEAEALPAGNPVYENGGTVEIRELPRTS